MVYTRQVAGRELTFGTSGKLYKDALVMYDRETGSLWTQVDGSVLRGALAGARLQPVPAMQTTWKEWKRLHPDTLVLKKDRPIEGSPYATYFANPAQLGIAGTQNPDSRLPGKALVVTVRLGEDALAVSVEALQKTLLYQTTVGGIPLVIVYHPASGTARVFDRRVGGRTLNFILVRHGDDVLLGDLENDSLWSGNAGKCVDGRFRGQELRPVPHMVNYWFAWVAYNPRTRLEPETKPGR